MPVLMKKLLLVPVVIILIVAGGIFYLLQPKSLGVAYAEADLDSIYQKLGIDFEPLVPSTAIGMGKSLIASGSHPVDQTFSSQELTAAADNRREQYSSFPFDKVQIRVNADGTVEGSGTVNLQGLTGYLVDLGVSEELVNEGVAKFKIPNTNLPVYLKVSGSIANNQSNLTVHQARVANINVPQDLINQYGPALNGLIESVIEDRQPSYNIETLKVENGLVHFQGTAPDKEQALR